MPEIDYNIETYADIKSALISKIPQYLPEWNDYSETDPGITLIELFAALGEMMTYKIKANLDESYLSTATLLTSVYNAAKMLGYTIRGMKPASCYLVFKLTGVQVNPYTIPKGTKVNSWDNIVTFITTMDLIIPAGALGDEVDGNGAYLYKVLAKNWTWNSDIIIGSVQARPDGTTDFLRFALPAVKDIVRESVEVFVYESGNWVQWSVVDTLAFSIGTNSDVFFEYDEDLYAYIVFGNGEMGRIPPIGIDNIKVNYGNGGGVDGNGYTTGKINLLQDALPSIAAVFNTDITDGGLEWETVDEIKNNIPKAWAKLYRIVTIQDYEAAAKEFGIGKAIAIYQGTVVNLYVINTDGSLVTQTIKDNLTAYIAARSFPGVSTLIKDAYPVTVDMQVAVTVLPGYDKNAVVLNVKNALDDSIFNIDKHRLGEMLRLGNAYQIIEDVSGVDFSNIQKFTRQIYARPAYTTLGRLTWTFAPISTLTDKTWIVAVTSSSPVKYSITDGVTIYDNISLGQTLVIPSEMSLKAELGAVPVSIGETFTIRTSKWIGDIEVDSIELLLKGIVEVY